MEPSERKKGEGEGQPATHPNEPAAGRRFKAGTQRPPIESKSTHGSRSCMVGAWLLLGLALRCLVLRSIDRERCDGGGRSAGHHRRIIIGLADDFARSHHQSVRRLEKSQITKQRVCFAKATSLGADSLCNDLRHFLGGFPSIHKQTHTHWFVGSARGSPPGHGPARIARPHHCTPHTQKQKASRRALGHRLGLHHRRLLWWLLQLRPAPGEGALGGQLEQLVAGLPRREGWARPVFCVCINRQIKKGL